MSGGVLSAVQTQAAVGVTFLSVTVAGAGPTAGEAPVSREAAFTLATVRSGDTDTLTGGLVAEGMLRSLGVAVAGWTERRRKSGGQEKRDEREVGGEWEIELAHRNQLCIDEECSIQFQLNS